MDWLSVSVSLVLQVLSPALVQPIGPDLPAEGFNNGTFRFAPEARLVLHNLWSASIIARQERIACIRGYRYDGVYYITSAEQVDFEQADSLHLSPDPESCAPPKWDGTAHTHIVLFDGRPFVTFSNADRSVMHWWRKEWDAEGAFCVLYSESQAYCELAHALNGDGTYAGNGPLEEMYYAQRAD
jgi:hypothetical protein